MYPDYNVERWHIFLIYLVWSLAAMAVNIWGIRLLPAINRIALFWSLMGGTYPS
jgi:choline transport protein